MSLSRLINSINTAIISKHIKILPLSTFTFFVVNWAQLAWSKPSHVMNVSCTQCLHGCLIDESSRHLQTPKSSLHQEAQLGPPFRNTKLSVPEEGYFVEHQKPSHPQEGQLGALVRQQKSSLQKTSKQSQKICVPKRPLCMRLAHLYLQ